MKYLLLFISFFLLTGCMTSRNMTKVIAALAKDPATAKIDIQTPYGYFHFERWMPTNSPSFFNPSK